MPSPAAWALIGILGFLINLITSRQALTITYSLLFFRYYAGDQEALFREAHLIHPKLRNPNPVIIVRTQSTLNYGAAASSNQEYICDICMISYQTEDMMGLECGHLFCRPCWNNYLTVMVMSEGRAQVHYYYYLLLLLLVLLF